MEVYARHELALDADTADVATTTFEVSTCTHNSIQLHLHIDYAADIYSSIDGVYCGTGLCYGGCKHIDLLNS